MVCLRTDGGNNENSRAYVIWSRSATKPGEIVTTKLNEQLDALGQRTLVNLTSDECFKRR